MNVGVVVTELLDGRFVPWERSLEWESYLDFYCLALQRRGHRCVKYVPSIGVARTESYLHKFGHTVKRVSAYNKALAPKALLRPREYALGQTTILGQLLGPAFTINLMKEARIDNVQVLHYSSYYSSFYVPAFIAALRTPMVAQYTGGALPADAPARLLWRISILPSMRASRAVLLGDYASERKSLTYELGVPRARQEFFNAPIVDSTVFHELNRQEAQQALGFDARRKNLLCVTYIPTRLASHAALAKNPFLAVDIIERAVATGGDEIEFHVAGWGQGADEFKDYVRERGMAGRVHLLGQVEHSRLPQYYAASDLVFIPYGLEKLNEGSATIEAFACSRAVVAFKRDASNQTDQSGGFLVDLAPEIGGRTLLDRLRRPGYLEEKGQEGLGLAREYTLEFAGRRLEEIYSKVTRNNQGLPA